jgi:hypothetical protein
VRRIPHLDDRRILRIEPTEAARRCRRRSGASTSRHAGNRFMINALFPTATVSIQVLWGKQSQNTVSAVGKSILNHTPAPTSAR